MKKIIITGAPRTGTTALATLLSQSSNILVTQELAIFDNDPNNYIEHKKRFLNSGTRSSHSNIRFLKEKGLTETDLDDFFNGNFSNKKNIEFFGDKFPTYCTSDEYCNHLVSEHYDAYFIFTYRDPCATIHSGIKRTINERNENADWFFNNIEISTNKLISQTSNWVYKIFPFIEKKIIIDYDHYINNVNLLISDLSAFFDTKIDIPEPEKVLGHTEIFDTGFRGLYEHSKPDEYKDKLTEKEIAFIRGRWGDLESRVRSFIASTRQ